MPRFFVCFAVQKAAAVRRKRLRQAFAGIRFNTRGLPPPSYSPCETERFFSKQRFFDKLRGGLHVRLFLTALSKHAFHHLPHLPLRQTVGGPEGEGKAVFGPQGHPDAAVISPPLDRRVPDG